MKWTRIKYPDKKGTFTVRLGGYIATRSDGVHVHYQDEGLLMIMENGEEFLCEWEDLYADFEQNRVEN